MMALGDKFEAQKGSARLRAALETAVPDDDYAPGLAHQLLVRLPWADLFTTNWDSLLERAVDTYDRSYDAVVTVEQIASTSAPRIVKLHGCARSGTRLIFTEEDFRTYPKTYAPFVSLVQQSLMENVLVLFGFSGADPNFRAWHGWVRDHLGSNIQPIYLVNLRPTDPIDVNLMAGRLINQIDLSQKREWQGLSASEMIESFLSEIHRRLRALRVNLDWPSSRKRSNDADPASKPATSYRDWQLRLEAYPHWLVAPARNRSDLLLALDEALTLTFDPDIERGVFAKLLEPHETPPARSKTSILTERERTALVVSESLRIGLARPRDRLLNCMKGVLASALSDIFGKIPVDVASSGFESIHEHFVRTFEVAGETDESVRANRLIQHQLTGIPLLGDAGLAKDVVVGLLPLIEIVEREARFRDDEITAQLLRNVLWVLGGEGAGRELAVRSSLAAALARLRIQEITGLLGLWPDQPHDAASNLRRAALLREIGWIRESYFEISNTVARLRSLGSARRRIVKESSLEAWAFYLYADLLEANREKLQPFVAPYERNLSLEEVIVELHERLDELETNRCDPRREVDRLSREMEAATIVRRLAPASARDAASKTSLQEVIADAASTFVILSETVGVSVNHTNGTNRMALSAARLLARDNRSLALGLTLRSGTPEDLPFKQIGSDHGSHARLLQLPVEEHWYVTSAVFDSPHLQHDLEKLAEALNSLVSPSPLRAEDLVDPPYLDRKVRLLQHVIAGLIIRDDGQMSDWVTKTFLLACRVARSPIISATRAGWSNQLQLFESVFRRIPVGTLTPQLVIRELLDLPIPSISDDSIVAGWPDPFRLLVSAWYPSEIDVTPRTELRKLGRAVATGAKLAIAKNTSLRSELNEIRRALRRIIPASGSQQSLIAARRLALLDAVLPKNTK